MNQQSSRRILIVDDNEDGAESLQMMLQVGGHEVETAGDGATALAAAVRLRPEVVLLDISLPDMDGYEVARRLRKVPECGGAWIVAVTGYSGSEDLRKCREAGIDRHVTKPLDPAALGSIIDRDAGKAS